jgi:hypothetical protein
LSTYGIGRIGNKSPGEFGQGKNGYHLNKISAKLKATSESWIAAIFFVMNLINDQKIKLSGLIFSSSGLFKTDSLEFRRQVKLFKHIMNLIFKKNQFINA